MEGGSEEERWEGREERGGEGAEEGAPGATHGGEGEEIAERREEKLPDGSEREIWQVRPLSRRCPPWRWL